MTEKLKYILTIGVSACLIFGFSVWFMLKEPSEYSESERRALSVLPSFSFEEILSGSFMKDFEEASPDQFPLRDFFRTIKAYSSRYIFKNLDNNKLFYTENHLSKLEYPENDKMLQNAADKFTFIYDEYIKNTDAEVFLSVIPDKNCFIAEKNGYLAFNYDKFAEDFRNKLPFATYIDIKPLLSADDYYTTDTHWKQENIVDVAEKLTSEMGDSFTGEFKENKIQKPFYGVYFNQANLKVPADSISYLTNTFIENAVVKNYDTGKERLLPVYDTGKLESPDMYEMFLSGTVAVSVIENPLAEEKNELILFRDSFSSSLAPLLTGSYSKITLVDIRYISSSVLSGLVDFENADKVLFLYSTILINNSLAFK